MCVSDLSESPYLKTVMQFLGRLNPRDLRVINCTVVKTEDVRSQHCIHTIDLRCARDIREKND